MAVFVGTPGSQTFIGTPVFDLFRLNADVIASGTRAFDWGVGTVDVNITGLSGTADTVNGQGGYDIVIGTSAGDVYDYRSAPTFLTNVEEIRGDAGNDVILMSPNYPTSIRIYGGAGHDVISGTNQADLLIGGPGDDVISGLAGNDRIEGGAGSDLIDGGAGADVIFTGPAGIGPHGLTGRIAGVTLPSGANEAYGRAGNDRIFGGPSVDRLWGGDGTDILRGGAGADVLNGEAGSDTIFGDAGRDVIRGGTDTGSYQLTIFNRLLVASPGDVLSGGQGADTFIYADGDGFDVIRDFNRVQGDHLQFSTGPNTNVVVRTVLFENVASTLIRDPDDPAGHGVVLRGVTNVTAATSGNPDVLLV